MGQVKAFWPVQTFRTQADKNYNNAINYYATKKQNFIKAIAQKKSQISRQMYTIDSLDERLTSEIKNFNSTIAKNWEKIYDSKISRAKLESALVEWNKATHIIDENMISGLGLIQLINQLSLGIAPIIPTNENALSSTSALSLDFLHQLVTQVSQETLTNQQYAGVRARALGEIFESLLLICAQEGLGDIFSVFKIGDQHTGFSSVGNKTVQGKSDIMLFVDNVTLQTNSAGLTVATTNTGEQVLLDALSWWDLETDGISRFNSMLNGTNAGVLGISAKQWNEKIIGHKTGLSSKASFGNSALTEAMIAQRWSPRGPKTISWVFGNAQNFTAYTGYIVSRYLVNIIGAYNGIMAFGNSMYFTSDWLQKIRSQSLMIAHQFKWGAVASKKRGTTADKAYNVTPHLVIAYAGTD